MNSEYQSIIEKAFPNVSIEREGNRIIINQFLSIEPKKVEVRSIGRSRKVDGFIAILDDGEDAIELYDGTDFWLALESCVIELSKFNLSMLRDKINPCLIPSRKEV